MKPYYPILAALLLTGCEEDVTCTFDGETYLPGESIEVDDGCNTCTCDDEGVMDCTELGCVEE